MKTWLKHVGRLGPLALTVLMIVGCGAGSEEEHYPALFPLYGGSGEPAELNLANFDQQFTMSDGETWPHVCHGMIRVLNQQESAWSGRAERGVLPWGINDRCYSIGELAGEVHMDRSIRFTLTQRKWMSMNLTVSTEQMIECTATGPGEYTGFLDHNRFYAVGTTHLVCADGREGTVRETMSGEYPAPPGSHDT